MNTASEIFCPVCKLKNDASATVCVHCQSPLHASEIISHRTTRKVSGEAQAFDTDELQKRLGIPADGIMVVLQESGQEIATVKEKRFILGRKVENVHETILDLSAYGAYGLGVSRLHLLIQKTKNGYEVSDMDSTNGTWLNDEELIPNKFYPISSGARIRLGKMYIALLFGG
ncbi:MAG: FHA domain-containing protein [Candidatus Latescibacteria bacterium]|nr:FHA domain-containing protein [Candidatus Latescibacterota bacterium]